MPSDRRPPRRLGREAKIAAWVSALALVLGAALLLGRGAAESKAPPSLEATHESPSARPSPPANTPSPVSPRAAGTYALPPEIARVIESGSKEPLVPRELTVEVQVAPRGKLTAEPLVPEVLDLPEPIPGERGAPLSNEPLVPRNLELPAE